MVPLLRVKTNTLRFLISFSQCSQVSVVELFNSISQLSDITLTESEAFVLLTSLEPIS